MQHVRLQNIMAEDEDDLEELRERLKRHSSCFNSLLELVPPKYYFTEIEQEQGGKFYKNTKNKAPKQVVKESSKKAKLARLDPSKHKSVIELQTEKDAKDAKNESYLSVEDVECANIGDLRAKLHQKIELLQRKRKHASLNTKVDSERPKKKSKKKIKAEKTEKNIKKQVKVDKMNGIGNKVITNNDGKVVFSKFDFSADVNQPPKKKNKKKNYKKLLERAESRKKKLEEMKGSAEAKEMVKQVAWKKALQKSEGVKQKDDPSLLKKAVKQKEKQKSKHQREWKERVENQKKQMKEKQAKREKNIKDRIQEKMKKKMKKGGRTPGF